MPTSNNPDPNAALATKSYWDARYDTTSSSTILVTGEEDSLGKAESYDWLKDFSFVRGFLEKWLPPADTGMEMGMGEGMGMENGKGKGPRILHAGNGNSTLPAALLQHLRYKHQTAIDFSPIITSRMQRLHPQIHFLEMDIRAMTFAPHTFDIVIDKATLDAMLYGSLWDPEDEVRENVGRYVDEVLRVLTPGGKFLYITWRQPHFIRPLLRRDGWECEVETVNPPVSEDGSEGTGGMLEYFGWVCVKK